MKVFSFRLVNIKISNTWLSVATVNKIKIIWMLIKERFNLWVTFGDVDKKRRDKTKKIVEWVHSLLKFDRGKCQKYVNNYIPLSHIFHPFFFSFRIWMELNCLGRLFCVWRKARVNQNWLCFEGWKFSNYCLWYVYYSYVHNVVVIAHRHLFANLFLSFGKTNPKTFFFLFNSNFIFGVVINICVNFFCKKIESILSASKKYLFY